MCVARTGVLLQRNIGSSAARLRAPRQTPVSPQQDTHQDIIQRERGVYLPHVGLWDSQSVVL